MGLHPRRPRVENPVRRKWTGAGPRTVRRNLLARRNDPADPDIGGQATGPDAGTSGRNSGSSWSRRNEDRHWAGASTGNVGHGATCPMACTPAVRVRAAASSNRTGVRNTVENASSSKALPPCADEP